MSNRQKQRGNVRNNINSANSEPILLEEAEEIKEVSNEESPAIEEGREYTTDDILLPDATEEIHNPSVDLEQEQEEDRRRHVAGELDVDEVLGLVSLTARMSLLGIIDYIEKMNSFKGVIRVLMNDKGFVTNQGPIMQAELFRNIMDIITKTSDLDFRYSMDLLMQLFVKHGKEGQPLNIFSLMRFQENIRLDLVEQQCYPNLMTMLSVLADPTTRSSKINKEIDMGRALQYGFSEMARNRLLAYFGR